MSEKKNDTTTLFHIICGCCSIGLALASIFDIKLLTYIFAIPSAIMFIEDIFIMIKRLIPYKSMVPEETVDELFDTNPTLFNVLSWSEIGCILLLLINLFIKIQFIGITFGLLYLFTHLYAVYIGICFALSNYK